MFPTEDELRKMNVKDIRAHIREMNEHYGIRGYSKMKKDQMINAIGTAVLRISKGAKGAPDFKKKPMGKKSSNPVAKSILESKLKQKPGRPAKTSTMAKKT